MFEITESTYLGELIDKDPMASKVLLKYGLDFCCEGQRSISDTCNESKVEIDLILQELEANSYSTYAILASLHSTTHFIGCHQAIVLTDIGKILTRSHH